MGNTPQKSSVLTRNWKPVDSHSYRNIITGELVDCHEVSARSEPEVQYHHGLLMRRAALAHPNVAKLIYYCNAEAQNLCSQTTFRIKVYLEHVGRSMARVGGREAGCICCGIVNGVRYLVERYGTFAIGQEFVWVVGQGRKRSVKVWVNSDQKNSAVESVASEKAMCEQLGQLLKCEKSRNIGSKVGLSELFECVYASHGQQPVGQQGRKKSMSMTSLSSSANNNSLVSDKITVSRRQPLGSKLTLEVLKEDDIQRKPSPIKKIEAKRMSSPKHRHQLQNDIFYRPEVSMNSSFSKKVNFNFTNGLATPKNNKTFQPKVNQSYTSPPPSGRPQGERVTHLTNSNKTVKEFPRQPALVSKFSRETELQIEEERKEQKLKDLLSSDIQGSNSSVIRESTFKVDFKDKQSVRQVFSQAVAPVSKQEIKKTPKLMLQKNLELIYSNYEPPVSQPEVKPSRQLSLKIGKEVELAVAPEFKPVLAVSPNVLRELPIEESGGFREEDTEEYHQPSFGIRDDRLNYGQNAISEESKTEREDKKAEATVQREKNYSNYLRQLQDVKKKTESYAPKAFYSDRMPPQQMQQSAPYRQSSTLQTKLSKAETEVNSRYQKPKEELESLYNESDEEEKKKEQIMQRINSTEEVLRENRKRLEMLRQERDLEREKGLLAMEMEGLLMGHNGHNEESVRIREKVRHKQATFAELKAEAAKILEDLNF